MMRIVFPHEDSEVPFFYRAMNRDVFCVLMNLELTRSEMLLSPGSSLEELRRAFAEALVKIDDELNAMRIRTGATRNG